MNRQFENHGAVEEVFKEFIESRDVDFYRKGINDLITRWQKRIQSQGCYFDYIWITIPVLFNFKVWAKKEPKIMGQPDN